MTDNNINMPSQTDSKSGRAYKTETVFICVVLAAALVLFILTGASTACVMAVIGVLWTLYMRSQRKKGVADWQENTKRIIIFTLVSFLINLFPPMSAGSTGKWRYPLIRRYIDCYNTVNMPSRLPDSIPDDAAEYRLEFLPSIMQGNGHFSVRYVCGNDSLDGFAESCRRDAIYTLTLADAENDSKAADIRYDRDFWAGHEESAVIYIFSGNFEHHYHVDCVIVDEENRAVQYFAD